MLLLTVTIPHVCLYGSYDPQTQHVSPRPSPVEGMPFFRLVISTSSKMSPVRFLQGRVEVETLSACWLSHPFGLFTKSARRGIQNYCRKELYIYIYPIYQNPLYYIQLTSSFKECMSPRNTVDASEVWGGFIPVWKEISAGKHLSFRLQLKI